MNAIKPISFLNPESKNYERDYKFAMLVFKGNMPRSAAVECKIHPNHGYTLLSRWRKKAEKRAGQAVSDTLILRSIVEPDSVKGDWETILTTHQQIVAKSDNHAKK